MVDWADQHGYAAEAEQLAAAPPNVAKGWIRQKGLNPDHMVGSAAAASSVDGADPGAGAMSAAGGGSPTTPGWSEGEWCTDELRGQIQAAIQAQGSHQDERPLLDGAADHMTTLGTYGSTGSPTSGSNTTRRVELDNGAVGYFKPFGGENKRLERGFGHDSAQQSLHEAAAWRLASQMGSPWADLVPPVVIREINGEIGSLQAERPGRTMDWEPWETGQWREAAFFDCLVGQQDRHPGNYLVAGDRIALIDHGYTFARPGDFRNYSWLSAKRTQTDPALTADEQGTLQRLVSSPDLMGLHGMVQPARALALRARAEQMLAAGTIQETY